MRNPSPLLCRPLKDTAPSFVNLKLIPGDSIPDSARPRRSSVLFRRGTLSGTVPSVFPLDRRGALRVICPQEHPFPPQQNPDAASVPGSLYGR